MSSDIKAYQQDASELAHAISGAGAGALAIAVTYPLVTISTKLQSEDKNNTTDGTSNKSAIDIIKDVYARNGLLGYYAGLESAIYGIAVTNFVYYYFYELSSKFIKVRSNTQLNMIQSMTSGAIAGSITALASNPIWIANTRMTVTKSDKSTLSTIIQIVREDGPMALFSGLKPALALVLNPIIQYTVFEQLKNMILALQKKRNQEQVLSPRWAFLLGALGKFAATGATYPYLTLKTRLHLAGQNTHEESSPADRIDDKKITMMSEALKIINDDGISGLYRGIGYKLIQSIMTAAFLFFFKEGLTAWSMRLLTLLRQILTFRKKTRFVSRTE